MIENLKDVVLLGDCLEILRQTPDNTFHAVVTDPPYGLGSKDPTPEEILAFVQGVAVKTGDLMGNDWDIPSVAVWKEVYRVLKPGGYVLSFGGTKTFDLISLGLRMAGFESRDTIADFFPGFCWVHGQGMPASHNISKALDKKAGAKREVIGDKIAPDGIPYSARKKTFQTSGSVDGWKRPGDIDPRTDLTAPATPEAKLWDGYGTGLKPSWEPIVVFRKPFPGTVADNVLKHGTGALNIDGCRVKHSSKKDFEEHKAQVDAVRAKGGVRDGSWKNASDLSGASEVTEAGRWPSNATLTHHPSCKIVGHQKVNAPVINRFEDGAKPFGDGAGHTYTSMQTGDAEGKEEVPIWGCAEGCPVKELDGQSGTLKSGDGNVRRKAWGGYQGGDGVTGEAEVSYGDSGGASRFFEQFQAPDSPFKYTAKPSKRETSLDGEIENDHVTKKPLELMRWLIRLVTFKGAHVLDPYCGSGTTLHAAAEEGVTYTGIENDPHYYEISVHRMDIVSGREQERQHQMSAFDLAMELGDEDS